MARPLHANDPHPGYQARGDTQGNYDRAASNDLMNHSDRFTRDQSSFSGPGSQVQDSRNQTSSGDRSGSFSQDSRPAPVAQNHYLERGGAAQFSQAWPQPFSQQQYPQRALPSTIPGFGGLGFLARFQSQNGRHHQFKDHQQERNEVESDSYPDHPNPAQQYAMNSVQSAIPSFALVSQQRPLYQPQYLHYDYPSSTDRANDASNGQDGASRSGQPIFMPPTTPSNAPNGYNTQGELRPAADSQKRPIAVYSTDDLPRPSIKRPKLDMQEFVKPKTAFDAAQALASTTVAQGVSSKESLPTSTRPPLSK